MPHKMFLISLLVACLWPFDCFAHGVASREDVICADSYIVVGKVTSFLGGNCTRWQGNCISQSQEWVDTLVKIEKIIAIKKDVDQERGFNFKVDDEIVFAIPMNNEKRVYKDIVITPPENYGHIDITPPTGTMLSNEELKKVFLDKEFVIAISTGTSILKDGITEYGGVAWNIEKEDWIRQTLAHHDYSRQSCPKLIKEN